MNDARPTILSREEGDRMRVTREEALTLFRKMTLIRRFEELAEEAYGRGRIGGFLHLYIGEEAVAVGSIAGLEPEDDVITHYRDHGYVLARGVDPRRVMAELYGKSTGLSKGKGGSMHLADVTRHVWGGYAIVGGHVPVAAGMALAHRYRNLPSVVACFLGDGATNIGTFFSSLNMAAVWRLPLVIIVGKNRTGWARRCGAPPRSRTCTGKQARSTSRRSGSTGTTSSPCGTPCATWPARRAPAAGRR